MRSFTYISEAGLHPGLWLLRSHRYYGHGLREQCERTRTATIDADQMEGTTSEDETLMRWGDFCLLWDHNLSLHLNVCAAKMILDNFHRKRTCEGMHCGMEN